MASPLAHARFAEWPFTHPLVPAVRAPSPLGERLDIKSQVDINLAKFAAYPVPGSPAGPDRVVEEPSKLVSRKTDPVPGRLAGLFSACLSSPRGKM